MFCLGDLKDLKDLKDQSTGKENIMIYYFFQQHLNFLFFFWPSSSLFQFKFEIEKFNQSNSVMIKMFLLNWLLPFLIALHENTFFLINILIRFD